MLTRFTYDKKKAKKAYRRRCWTEYWYLSVLLLLSNILCIYSWLKIKPVGMIIFVLSSISLVVIRDNFAADNCKRGQNVDITDEHLIIRWIHQENIYDHSGNYGMSLEKTRITKQKIVVPIASIQNLKTDKKSKRITFDYKIQKSKACKNKSDTRDTGHMVLYDVYDKSLSDELLILLQKQEQESMWNF